MFDRLFRRLFRRFLRGATLAAFAAIFVFSSGAFVRADSPNAPIFAAFDAARGRGTLEKPVLVDVPKGVYTLDADRLPTENFYVSNIAARNPKSVGLVLRGLKNAIVDFNDSELLTRGPVLALVVEDCENVVVRNFRLDSKSPAMVQTEIVRNDAAGIVFRVASWATPELDENGRLVFVGDGWRAPAPFGNAFDPTTKRTLLNVADVGTNFDGATIEPDGLVVCPNWNDRRLVVGSKVVLRVDTFHLPGVFINRCKNITMRDVQIHYAPCKAIVAQRSENLTFDGVSISLRDGLDGERCFTANADAIHCSCCKGKIVVENGLFESMMDDAINVHGIYVRISNKIDERTLAFEFAHSEAFGFDWAEPGDVVRFLDARKMQRLDGDDATVESVRPIESSTAAGAKRFEITFEKPIPKGVAFDGTWALENLTQTAEVVYRNNIVRNNRARGCLFSTFKPVLVEGNTFDCVSGTAILFCGDANGWFESGPCENVVVRKNRFVNCMTAIYQFCAAPIAIYPEIPDFGAQTRQYDGGNENAFLFEENVFNTFDSPILYARSTDGVTFRGNTIRRNDDFAPIAPNVKPFVFEFSDRIRIYDNDFDDDFEGGFDPTRDVDASRTPIGSIRFSKDEAFGAPNSPRRAD